MPAPKTPLNIKDPEAHKLARQIAAQTGKNLTRVVIDALRNEKMRLSSKCSWQDEKVRELLARVDALPRLDPRTAKVIEGDLYDQNGLPR